MLSSCWWQLYIQPIHRKKYQLLIFTRDIGETLLIRKTQVFLERWTPRAHRWSSSFWKMVFVHFHVVLLPNVMLNSIQVNHLWMHTVVIYFLLISFVKGLLLLEHKSSLWASCEGGGKWLNHRWAHACWSAWMTNLSKASRQKSLSELYCSVTIAGENARSSLFFISAAGFVSSASCCLR